MKALRFILAALMVGVVALVAVAVAGLFAWFFVMALIHSPYLRPAVGLFIILALASLAMRLVSSTGGSDD